MRSAPFYRSGSLGTTFLMSAGRALKPSSLAREPLLVTASSIPAHEGTPVHVLGELAVPGVFTASLAAAVRVLNIVLNDRQCKALELHRQLERTPASKPAKAVGVRHRCRRLR